MFYKIKRRIWNLFIKANYLNAMNIAATTCNHTAFADIKNINNGKAVAICGAGPTLTQYKPIDNCLHIALNRALLNKNVPYKWFIADDWDGIDFIQNEIINFDGIKFLGCVGFTHASGNIHIPESFRIKCKARKYYTDLYLVGSGYESKFVCDIDKMAIGAMPNIALQTMQIALFTNPSKLYIVGCDASQGHFIQPQNLSEQRIARHERDLLISVLSDRVINMWKKIKEFASIFYPDTEIISINPVGLKGIFHDEYQEGYQEDKN